jgi:hypothetical protein
MNTAPTLNTLAVLEAAGLILTTDGDALTASPKALLTDELRATIRDHKPSLIVALLDRRLVNGATWLGDREPMTAHDAQYDSALYTFERLLVSLEYRDGEPVELPSLEDRIAADRTWQATWRAA